MLYEGNTGATQSGFLDPNGGGTSRRNGVIKFDLSSITDHTVIASATLMLDLDQYELGMEGATLFANRLTKPFIDSRASWTNATSSRDKWATAGGDYTLVDEGRTTILPAVTYNIDVTKFVDGWVKGSFANNGLIVRTDGVSASGSGNFRLKKNVGKWPTSQWPRLEIKGC